ncbi:hypothetical protein ACFLS9_09640 [Bacteroidota bacterium]
MKAFKSLLLLIFPLFLFIASCCITDPEDKDPPKPPGYQEDIPWPSLADSPWPMFRGDPQNTGRSKGLGPLSGIIEWSIDTINIHTGIVMGPDSTIYFGVVGDSSGLYALNLDGTIKWIFPIDIYSGLDPLSPIISSEGTIYISSPREYKLYAINSDGTLKWISEDVGFTFDDVGMNIGLDGTIFFRGFIPRTGNSGLYGIDKNGFVSISYLNEDLSEGMSFSPDGNTIYISGIKGRAVYAFDILTQTIKWRFGQDIQAGIYHSPLIDNDGNIYVLSKDYLHSGSLFSIDPEGKVRWQYKLGAYSSYFNIDIAMDKYGNIYLGYNTIVSVDYNGNLRWELELDAPISSPIVIDQGNIIYFTTQISEEYIDILAVTSNGEMLWKLNYPDMLNYGNSYHGFAVGFGKLLYPGYKTQKIISIN